MTEKDIKKVLELRQEAVDHYNEVIKTQNFKYGYSQFAIDLLDGNIDMSELILDYIMEKLENEKN